VKTLNTEQYEEFYQLAIKMLQDGEQVEAIEQQLARTNSDIILITVVIKEARNAHYALLRKQGFRLLFVGCVTCLCGFLITFINFHTNRQIDFALYGLTSVGVTIAFCGLFKIFG